MKASTMSLMASAVLASVALVCTALPMEPQQVVSAAQNGDWLLYGSVEDAPEPKALANGQQVRERRDLANDKKKDKSKKPKKPEKKGAFEKECLAAHNSWRKLHQAKPLVWDNKIAEFSRKRADHIAKSDGSEFKHPSDLVYGENLAWHSWSTTTCYDLIKMWYDEVKEYDFNRPKFDHETGHFTQLVWRQTRRVGCAKQVSTGPRGGVYLVCNYDPPGNYLGEEASNVLPASVKAVSSSPRLTTVETTTTTTTTVTTTTTATPTTSTTVAPTTDSLATTTTPSTTSTSISKKKKKQTDKNKRKKKGNKNKKKRRKKKRTTTTTTTTTVATPTG